MLSKICLNIYSKKLHDNIVNFDIFYNITLKLYSYIFGREIILSQCEHVLTLLKFNIVCNIFKYSYCSILLKILY